MSGVKLYIANEIAKKYTKRTIKDSEGSNEKISTLYDFPNYLTPSERTEIIEVAFNLKDKGLINI